MNRVLGGIGLVAGTSIGAVTLVLPVLLSALGLYIAVALMLLFWLMMYWVGLLVYEVNACLPLGSSYLSMARLTLGTPGLVFSWISYVFLLCSLLAAYLVGMSGLTEEVMQSAGARDWPYWLNVLPWLVLAVWILYGGPVWVDRLNRIMILGLAICFLPLVVLLAGHIQFAHFHIVMMPTAALLPALPILITAFGYQVVLPSVRLYLQASSDKMPQVILWGSLIPLGLYLIWTLAVFSAISQEGEWGLSSILKSGNPASALPKVIGSLWHSSVVYYLVTIFEYCALISSFLAISLSLFDLLADGLRQVAIPCRRVVLTALTLVPACLYAGIYPNGFMQALVYAGGFVAILNGLIPVAMSMMVRYRGYTLAYRTPYVWWVWSLIIIGCGFVLWSNFSMDS